MTKEESYRPENRYEKFTKLPCAFVFGIDLLLDTDGNWKIVEINGLNCGTEGFARTGENINPKIRTIISQQLAPYGGTAVLLAEAHLNNYQEQWFLPGESADNAQHIKIVKVKIGEQDYKQSDSSKLIQELELLLSRKDLTDEFILNSNNEILISGKSVSQKFSLKNLRTMIKEGYEGKIIIKPQSGSNGSGIMIVDLAQRLDNRLFAVANSNEYIFEKFVESQKIEDPNTGKLHTASMRQITVVTARDLTNFTVTPVSGYWRLAPENTEIANLTNKRNPAIPISAAPTVVQEANLFCQTYIRELTKFFDKLQT